MNLKSKHEVYHMLTGDAKSVLNHIRQENESFEQDFVMIHPNDFETMTYKQVTEIIKYLEREECIEILQIFNERGWIVRLRTEGRNYEERERNKARIGSYDNSTNINIQGNVTGSAIGNLGTTTVNNGITYEEIRKIVQTESLNQEDKDLLLEMIAMFKNQMEKEELLKPKSLSKFRSVIEKCSDKGIETIIQFLGSQAVRFFLG